MPSITQVLTVVCVHGEGDRATVNRLKKDRNLIFAQAAAQARQPIDPDLQKEPNEPADVTAVLRDDAHNTRVELNMTDWDSVEAFKAIAGYDTSADAKGLSKRHWIAGGKIRVTISEA